MGLRSLSADFPAGQVEAPPAVFRWSGVEPGMQSSVVVLASDYTELARIDGIVGTELTIPAAVRAALLAEGSVHWRVLSKQGGDVAYSPLKTVEIR
jgi:hypothetical protein